MRSLRLLIALAICGATGTARAQDDGGWIMDPENPAFSEGEGEAGEEEEDTGSGWIIDPENPAFEEGEDDVDDEVEVEIDRPDARFTPTGSFRGEWNVRGGFDFEHERAAEDTTEWLSELGGRIRYRFAERWTVIMRGRLSWWLTAGSDDAPDSVFAPDGDRWQGRLDIDLRDFYVSGRLGSVLLRVGQQAIVWGSGDILRPADFINPRDLRRGFFSTTGSNRVGVPAVSATWIRDRLAVEAVLVPFFIPNRLDAFGSDNAALRPGSGLATGLPIQPLIGALVDPTMEEFVQDAILTTERPDEIPQNASAGLRATSSYGGWDVSLGYFYGFDRFPNVQVSEGAQSCIDLLSGLPQPDGLTFSQLLDQLTVLEAVCPDLVSEIDAGEPIFTSSYERAHFAEFDAVTYLGLIGLRIESALFADQTFYGDGLSAERHPALLSTVGLSYESGTGEVVVTTELFYQRILADDADDLSLFGQDFGGAGAGLQLDLGAFSETDDPRWTDLALQLGGFYSWFGDDFVLAAAASFAVSDSLTLTGGANVFGAYDDSVTSIGDVYDENDSWFVELSGTF